MTPFAERVFMSPTTAMKSEFLRDHMAGCQFFDCVQIQNIIKVRSLVPGDGDEALEEVKKCELPSKNTWLQFEDHAVFISSQEKGSSFEGRIIQLTGGIAYFSKSGHLNLLHFAFFECNNFGVWDTEDVDCGGQSPSDMARSAVNKAWYAIEAMQTPGGLCHQVQNRLTRQMRRASERDGRAVHKFVEIKLGRPKINNSKASGQTGKSISWHYRRGHRVNHPNPNYPKWRRGAWVGDPQRGIRTHKYVVQVPE